MPDGSRTQERESRGTDPETATTRRSGIGMSAAIFLACVLPSCAEHLYRAPVDVNAYDPGYCEDVFLERYEQLTMGLDRGLLAQEVERLREKPMVFMGHFHARGRVVFYWKLPAEAKGEPSGPPGGYGVLELKFKEISKVQYMKRNDFGSWHFLCNLPGRWVVHRIRAAAAADLEQVLFDGWDLDRARETAAERSWDWTRKTYDNLWFEFDEREPTQELCDVFAAMAIRARS
jgi:hypothetical protein